MSKSFKITLAVLFIAGIAFFHLYITDRCEDKYYALSTIPCEDRFMCKVKIIKTKEQVEMEMKKQGIYGISGPHAVTKCIPVYNF